MAKIRRCMGRVYRIGRQRKRAPARALQTRPSSSCKYDRPCSDVAAASTAIRLVGIDVDGTLVGASGVVNPVTWTTAQRARHCGIHLALCSGRPSFGTALAYARRLSAQGWHVFQNGASIIDLATSQSHSVPIPPVWVHTLIAQARVSGETLELYGDDAYVTESTSPWARTHAELLGVPFAPRPLESLSKAVVRAQWLLSPGEARRFMLLPHPGLEVAQSTSPLMPDTRFVGLTNQGVSKGNALRKIAEQYGVSLLDVMYVGDSGNDLSALRIVGHPIAMADSDPAVLAIAAHSVGSADDGGVAQALEMAIATVRR
jgi:Cof subfamily protein (haloacid dehalogenase superfamily)